MKKINIYFFAHYAPERKYGSALRYYNWIKRLIPKGYSFTIFCSSAIHNSELNLINDNKFWIEHNSDGIRYIYIKTRQYKGNGIQRILNMIDYYKNLLKVIYSFEKPDCIIARSPHPFCCVLGIKVAKHWNIPCISDIVDLWPQSIVEILNISRNNPIIIALYRLEKWIYRRSNALIFSMAGGAEYIKDQGWQNSIDLSKVNNINIGVDIEEFDKNKELYTYDDPLLLDNEIFKIAYCGSVRLANNIKNICECALKLQALGYSNIFFMIHGAGDQIETLRDYCTANNIRNIKFYGYIKKEQIPYVLTHSDINFLSFQQLPLMKYGTSQNKLFEYLAASRPILSSYKSGYNLIEEYHCGVISNDQSSESLAEEVLKLYNMNKHDREQMGINARRAAEDYDQPKLVAKLENLIEQIFNKKN